MNSHTLHHGDCLAVLKTLPAESVDAVVTDPPYGLSNHDAADVAEALRAWLDGKPYSPKGSGFMGKSWDAFVPGPEVWRECLRVLKPGGHLLVFAGTRTQDLMGIAVRLAGFDSRDAIRVEGLLAWEYGCLSDDTEVLVDGEWVHYHKAIEGRFVLCYDTEDGTYAWHSIERRYVYDYDDTAYRIESPDTDQVVSRNHRCLVLDGGKWVFRVAEEAASESEVHVPILKDLSRMLQGLPLPHERAKEGEEDVLRRVPEELVVILSSRENQTTRPTNGDDSNRVLGMQENGVEAESLGQEIGTTNVFQQVQRDLAWGGVGEARTQGVCGGQSRRQSECESEDDGTAQPCVEGRGDVQEEQGKLHRPEVRQVPCGVPVDGPQGRVCHGAPAGSGDPVGQVLAPIGSSPPCRSRHEEQLSVEPDVVRIQPGSQAVRGEGYTASSVARITPFHLTGKVWCVKVPTGAFVARRNGKVFVTGNSGFPKSLSVSKAIDKAAGAEREVVGTRKLTGNAAQSTKEKGGTYASNTNSVGVAPIEVSITAPATDAAKQWDGWGTALKPSHEPVLMFRKPLIGTVAENVIAHGTGALNIDGCRIEGGDPANLKRLGKGYGDATSPSFSQVKQAVVGGSVLGRWPPNTVLVHTPDCKQVGTRTVKAPVINRFTDGMKPFGDGAGHPYESVGGGDEEIPVWECPDGCPVKALDEQSGSSSSSVRTGGEGEHLDPSREGWRFKRAEGGFNDAGGASRFFPQFSYTAEEAPFRYMAKAGRSERDEGVVGTPAKQMDESRDPDAPGANNPRNRGGRVASNFHPTVKPIELMRWLARLVTQPNGTVLDPFMGSGSTGCAAMYEGFNFIGIEQSDEYLEIARQRIEYHSLRARGGVVSPWENSAPAPAEKPEAKTDPGSLEDLFGFGE